MTTQESHNETRHGLASENATLRNQLHTIGVEAARALDWTNEETWKKALQRIAALARAEEATKSTTPACKRTMSDDRRSGKENE